MTYKIWSGREMTSEEELYSFCSSLGISIDYDRFAILSRQADGEARITVIGLVSRGKSTLINQLVGKELCPVDARGETAAIIEISKGTKKAQARIEPGDLVEIGSSPEEFRERLPRRVAPTITWASYSGPLRLPVGITLVDTPGIDDASTVDEKLLYLEKHWTKSGAIGALVVLSVPPGMGRSDAELVDSAKRVFGNNFEIVLKATDSEIEEVDLLEVGQQVERHTGKRPILVPSSPEIGEWGKSGLAGVENAIDRLSSRSKEIVSRSSIELSEMFELISRTILSSNYSIERLRKAKGLASNLPSVIRKALDNRLLEIRSENERKERLKEEEERTKKLKALDNQANDLVKLLPSRNSDLQVRLHGPAVKELFKLCLEQSKVAETAIKKLMALPSEVRLQFGLDARELFKRLPEDKWIDLVKDSQLVDYEAIAMVGIVSGVSADKSTPLLKSFLSRANQDQIEKTLTASKYAPMTSIILETFRKVVVSDFQSLISRSSHVVAIEQLLRSNEFLQETYKKRLKISSVSDSSQEEIHYAKIFKDLEKSAYQQSVKVLNQTNAEIRSRSISITKGEIVEHRRVAYPVAQKIASYDSKLGQPLVDVLAPSGFLEAWYESCVKNREQAVRRARSLDFGAKAVYYSSFFLWFISVVSIATLQGGSVVLWLVSLVMWLVTRDRPNANWEAHFVQPDFNKVVESVRSANQPITPFEPPKSRPAVADVRSRKGVTKPGDLRERPASRLVIFGEVVILLGILNISNPFFETISFESWGQGSS